MFDDEVLMEEMLINNCTPYLKVLKNLGKNNINRSLLRGSAEPFEELTRIDVRPRTQTMNMPRQTHDIANEWFKEKFGFGAREDSVFCTANRGQAKSYGFINRVFPIGKFQIIHSNKVSDLFIYLLQDSSLSDLEQVFDRAFILKHGKTLSDVAKNLSENDPENYAKLIRTLLDNADYQKNSFKEAFTSNNEIMLKCKAFYIIKDGERIQEFLNDFVWSEF